MRAVTYVAAVMLPACRWHTTPCHANPPSSPLPPLPPGNLLVEEQENVKRVQLADEYLSGAALAGASGSSLPEGYQAR